MTGLWCNYNNYTSYIFYIFNCQFNRRYIYIYNTKNGTWAVIIHTIYIVYIQCFASKNIIIMLNPLPPFSNAVTNDNSTLKIL